MALCGSRRRCTCAITGNDLALTGDGSEADPFDLSVALVPWTAFTPTFTNVTVGNGVRYGRYKLLGKLLLVEARFKFGSSSSFGTSVHLTLPASQQAMVGPGDTYMVVGSVGIRDAATRFYVGSAVVSASTPTLIAPTHSESGNSGFVNATAPMTWANGDELLLNLALEVQ